MHWDASVGVAVELRLVSGLSELRLMSGLSELCETDISIIVVFLLDWVGTISLRVLLISQSWLIVIILNSSIIYRLVSKWFASWLRELTACCSQSMSIIQGQVGERLSTLSFSSIHEIHIY